MPHSFLSPALAAVALAIFMGSTITPISSGIPVDMASVALLGYCGTDAGPLIDPNGLCVAELGSPIGPSGIPAAQAGPLIDPNGRRAAPNGTTKPLGFVFTEGGADTDPAWLEWLLMSRPQGAPSGLHTDEGPGIDPLGEIRLS